MNRVVTNLDSTTVNSTVSYVLASEPGRYRVSLIAGAIELAPETGGGSGGNVGVVAQPVDDGSRSPLSWYGGPPSTGFGVGCNFGNSLQDQEGIIYIDPGQMIRADFYSNSGTWTDGQTVITCYAVAERLD